MSISRTSSVASLFRKDAAPAAPTQGGDSLASAARMVTGTWQDGPGTKKQKAYLADLFEKKERLGRIEDLLALPAAERASFNPDIHRECTYWHRGMELYSLDQARFKTKALAGAGLIGVAASFLAGAISFPLAACLAGAGILTCMAAPRLYGRFVLQGRIEQAMKREVSATQNEVDAEIRKTMERMNPGFQDTPAGAGEAGDAETILQSDDMILVGGVRLRRNPTPSYL